MLDLPADKVLGLGTDLLVGRKVQVSGPVDNLAVCVVRLLGAERRPANKTLEHDGAHTPPIAAVVVALAAEDFGSNVVRGTDGRVSELAARLAPGVDLVAVTHRQLNLVKRDGLAVGGGCT